MCVFPHRNLICCGYFFSLFKECNFNTVEISECVLKQVVGVVFPSTGWRTRNTSILLRLNFSEPLLGLRVGYVGSENISFRAPEILLVVNSSGDGSFSLELLGVDLAGNVQLLPTVFSWTTDTSTFFSSNYLLS